MKNMNRITLLVLAALLITPTASFAGWLDSLKGLGQKGLDAAKGPMCQQLAHSDKACDKHEYCPEHQKCDPFGGGAYNCCVPGERPVEAAPAAPATPAAEATPAPAAPDAAAAPAAGS